MLKQSCHSRRSFGITAQKVRRLVEPAHFYLFSHSAALLLLAAEEFRQGLALLEPLVILGRRGELDVARRVERSLDRVLNDADGKADADDLHRDVVRDAEQRARHRDEQQRAARHAGSAARAEGRHDREQNRRGQRDLHTQRIGRGQRHDGDGDGRAVHVDRRAEGDRDGVEVLVHAELFAHRHVHGDIRRGRAGEERRQAAFTQAAEHQRIRVAVQIHKDDKGRDDQCHKEHGAHQQGQQLAVLGKDGQAVAGNVGVHLA